MDTKKIILVIIGIIALLALFFFSRTLFLNEGSDLPGIAKNDDTLAEGIVVEVNAEQVAVDGPYLITVEESDGGHETVAIPSMGINLCPARGNIADVNELKNGIRVEAYGSLSPDGDIVLCESPEHYLRVVAVE